MSDRPDLVLEPWQVARRERVRPVVDAYLGDLDLYEDLRINVEMGIYCGPEYSLACFYAGEPMPPLFEDDSDWVYVALGPYGDHGWADRYEHVTPSYMFTSRNVNEDIVIPLGEYPPLPVTLPGRSFVEVSCNGEAVRYDIPERKVLVDIPPSVQAGDVVTVTLRGGAVTGVSVDRTEREVTDG